MEHIYGEFSKKQIMQYSKLMHNEIHKLLLYEDPNITEKIFDNEQDFKNYFHNLLVKFSGLNELLNYPVHLINFISTLQAAYSESQNNNFNFKEFRRLILDAHGYISSMFGEV